MVTATRTTCPRCGELMPENPHRYSTSRRDNVTHICPECGESEAIVDLLNRLGAELPPWMAIREHLFYLHITRRM